jgi:hypothetical protein
MDPFHTFVIFIGGCLVVCVSWSAIQARWREERLRSGLTIDPRWRPLVRDERILRALAILHAHAPIKRPYIKKLRKRRVRILVESIEGTAGAHYHHSRNAIVITPSVVREPITVLAAVVAHELGHIRKRGWGCVNTQADVCDWVEGELTSHTLEALVWRAIRMGREKTTWAAKLNRQLAAYERGELVGFITTMKSYQKTFFGRELHAKGIKS